VDGKLVGNVGYGLAKGGALFVESIDEKQAWLVPPAYDYAAGDKLVPLRAGESLTWTLVS